MDEVGNRHSHQIIFQFSIKFELLCKNRTWNGLQNKLLNKQLRGWSFEMAFCSCDVSRDGLITVIDQWYIDTVYLTIKSTKHAYEIDNSMMFACGNQIWFRHFFSSSIYYEKDCYTKRVIKLMVDPTTKLIQSFDLKCERYQLYLKCVCCQKKKLQFCYLFLLITNICWGYWNICFLWCITIVIARCVLFKSSPQPPLLISTTPITHAQPWTIPIITWYQNIWS